MTGPLVAGLAAGAAGADFDGVDEVCEGVADFLAAGVDFAGVEAALGAAGAGDAAAACVELVAAGAFAGSAGG